MPDVSLRRVYWKKEIPENLFMGFKVCSFGRVWMRIFSNVPNCRFNNEILFQCSHTNTRNTLIILIASNIRVRIILNFDSSFRVNFESTHRQLSKWSLSIDTCNRPCLLPANFNERVIARDIFMSALPLKASRATREISHPFHFLHKYLIFRMQDYSSTFSYRLFLLFLSSTCFYRTLFFSHIGLYLNIYKCPKHSIKKRPNFKFSIDNKFLLY